MKTLMKIKRLMRNVFDQLIFKRRKTYSQLFKASNLMKNTVSLIYWYDNYTKDKINNTNISCKILFY